MRTKRKTEQAIIDKDAQRVLERLIPSHWELRPYRPDFGLDYSLELFKSATDEYGRGNSRSTRAYDTLGEHLFLQLKGSRSVKRIVIDAATECERAVRAERGRGARSIPVVSFRLDTAELETARRMGAGLPVLLVVADVQSGDAYFLCLNDYIDKVLVRGSAYAGKKTQVVYIPLANVVGGAGDALVPLRAYAKRSKLYSAFQQIIWQREELGYVFDSPEWGSRLKLYSDILLKYDFWEDCEWWGIVEHYRRALTNVHAGLPPGTMKYLGDPADAEMIAIVRHQEESSLWDGLAALARTYEEVVREWWLPM